jgi:micrococcal nuclease
VKTVLFLVTVLLAGTAPALAATYSPSQAADHIGETATISGPVSETHVDDRSGVGFINMGGRHPHQDFTGFIPRSALGRFGDLHRYDGKSVSITGKIRDYNGTPEIILSDPDQIGAR